MSQNPSLYAILSESAEPTQVTAQYVWGARPGHRDELVRRDRDSNGDGTLDERIYCLMDYFNPTAIVDETGAVVERYGWSAFGVRTVMDADWTERSSSAYAFDFGFHGQFLDDETGYYNYGFRYYNPKIGRWLSRDPIGETGGRHVYAYARNMAVNSVDYLGLWTRCGSWTETTRGNYIGKVCAQEGDTWKELVALILGSESNYPVPEGNPTSGNSYSVDALLLELDRRLREATVLAASAFSTGFEVRLGDWGATSAGINSCFVGTGGMGMECSSANTFILAKAVLDIIGANDFDDLYTAGDFQRNSIMIKAAGEMDASEMYKGDWAYVKGFERYDISNGPWQGENIISLGGESVWGQGLPSVINTVSKVESFLRQRGNHPDPGRFVGFKKESVGFINVSRLAIDIFDHRNGDD